MTAIKAIFFDIRDTLGEVDRPGHLIPYRPSTEQLLDAVSQMHVTLGAITNLPDNVTDEQGRDMLCTALLSEDEKTGKPKTIGNYILRENIVTNHEAAAALKLPSANKPWPEIYKYAADKLKLKIEECLYIGENTNEVLGARLAGMQAERKECPPGRDFAPALVGRIGASAVDSGRQFEALLKHEHLLGERIFACGELIARELKKLVDGKAPPLDQPKWISPPSRQELKIPESVYSSMGYYVYLIEHFADQIHLQAEEAMIEVAVACGMNADRGQWILDQHEQARAYWSAMKVAWRRIERGDDDDRFYAIWDFQKSLEAFVFLFEAHAVRENYQLYPEAGTHFNDTDDAMVLNLLQHFGPADITPYVAMVERMESKLGIAKR